MATIRAIATWFNARRRLVSVVLSGWVVVVVISAGRMPDADEWIVVPDLGGVLAAVFGLFAVVELALLVYLRRSGRSGFGPRPTRSLPLWALVLGAISLVLLVIMVGPRETPEEQPPAEQERATTAQEEGVGDVDDPRSGADDYEIVALILIGVIAGAVLLRAGKHRTAAASDVGDEPDEPLEPDLGSAIDEATEHLQFGTEPRMAVLAAYASLERALAERGQHRGLAETPTEHLARVLAALPVLASSAVPLGRLYELARFSDHPITDSDRERAADALARTRRILMTPASGPL